MDIVSFHWILPPALCDSLITYLSLINCQENGLKWVYMTCPPLWDKLVVEPEWETESPHVWPSALIQRWTFLISVFLNPPGFISDHLDKEREGNPRFCSKHETANLTSSLLHALWSLTHAQCLFLNLGSPCHQKSTNPSPSAWRSSSGSLLWPNPHFRHYSLSI